MQIPIPAGRPQLDSPYLSRQLIAYIGNKRRLLPLIERAVRRCAAADGEQAPTFVDFFAGSGAVAKLAKTLGFSVIANDWEEYSWLLNEAFLVTNRTEVGQLFADRGGLSAVLEILNGLEAPAEKDRYVSRYYAPSVTDAADPERERMFYTQENASRIDAIRAWIEREYPGEILDEVRTREKRLLLGLLLYEAATHANTSGVFKAYHRGFGGRGGDALVRILGRIELEAPELIDGRAEAVREDAGVLARRLARRDDPVDIAYLDPPYNQHQYGSNYHLLNTIARNDRPQIREKPVSEQGKRADKAGIRRDWTKTRSPFCSRTAATDAFAGLVREIKARHILVSYSTDGMIPVRRMAEILGARGRLEIALAEYTRYRGGKQALTTTLNNVEFVLIAHTDEVNTAADTREVLQTLALARMESLLKRSVSPAALVDRGYLVTGFARIDADLVFERKLSSGLALRLMIGGFKRIVSCEFLADGSGIEPGDMDEERFSLALAEIAALTAITREEELSVTLNWARYLHQSGNAAGIGGALTEIPLLLKKFNDRKAYQASLEYLGQALELAAEIRGCDPGPVFARRYSRFARQLGLLVERKLAVVPASSSDIVAHLRTCVSDRYARLAAAADSGG